MFKKNIILDFIKVSLIFLKIHVDCGTIECGHSKELLDERNIDLKNY